MPSGVLKVRAHVSRQDAAESEPEPAPECRIGDQMEVARTENGTLGSLDHNAMQAVHLK